MTALSAALYGKSRKVEIDVVAKRKRGSAILMTVLNKFSIMLCRLKVLPMRSDEHNSHLCAVPIGKKRGEKVFKEISRNDQNP